VLPFVDETSEIVGRRILVVDDNSASRAALESLLGHWKLRSTVVPDARSARSAIEQVQSADDEYAALLIDAHMPGVDGFQLAEEVLRQPVTENRPIVMLLESFDLKADMSRCDELGVTAYLVKPVNESELFDTLVALICGEKLSHSTEAVPSDHEASSEVRPLEVLLAEDSPYNQKLAFGVLQRRGHRVTLANNGREAVDAVRKHRFDIILMDLQMPEMDGLQATQIIRSREQETDRHVPIVAMTAQAMEGVRERCLECGMDDYLVKPVRAKELIAAVESADSPLPVADKESAAQQSELPAAEFDWSCAMAVVDGDEELLAEVIQAFLEECPTLMAAICAACMQQDSAALQLSAHTLKGALRTFGESPGVEAARRLETMGHEGRFDQAEVCCERLQKELEILLPEARAFVQRSGSTAES
jgi:CheY-like chemotaxis protein